MKKILCVILAILFVIPGLVSVTGTAQAVTTKSTVIDNGLTLDDLPIKSTMKPLIQNPTTFTNPISVTSTTGSLTTTGEPVFRVFNDEYYFVSRGQKGYWHSKDFKDWDYISAPNYAGGIPGFVEIKGKLFGYCGNSESRVWVTDDPKTGVWRQCGTFSSNNYGDASMLYDEEQNRLFMYYGWSQLLGIRVVEVKVPDDIDHPENDPEAFKEISAPVVAVWGDPYDHGWETRYAQDDIYPYFQTRDYREEEFGWTEGGHPLKYNGKYYLMFATIGLEFFSYGHGVYVADDPLGPYKFDENGPLSMKTTGVAPGAGHGSIWVDRDNNVWTAAMMCFPANGAGGPTLLNLYPTIVDEDGVMNANEEYSDYPQYLPGLTKNPGEDSYTGWALLTLNKEVKASSTAAGNNVASNVVDESATTFWSAGSGNAGEWVTVDIGDKAEIRGVQVLWDGGSSGMFGGGGSPHKYTIEVSDDGEAWTTIVDKSDNVADLRSDYIELPAGLEGRYLRLTNAERLNSGNFSVKALRAFGNPDKATFTMANNVKVVRNILDRRKAHVQWDSVEGAEGYNVRYGIAPGKLYNSYTVYGDTNFLDLHSLSKNPEYYFEVEAFSSGTPIYEAGRAPAVADYSDTVALDAAKNNWAILTLNKENEASSQVIDTALSGRQAYSYWASYAVDAKPSTNWIAKTGNAGENLIVDIGAEATIKAIDVVWAKSPDAINNAPVSYKVEVSDDKVTWTNIINKADVQDFVPSEYTVLDVPVTGRYLRLTNAKYNGNKFAVSTFRAFGNTDGTDFSPVEEFDFARSLAEPNKASIQWEAVEGAEGYIINYGPEGEDLNNGYVVYSNNYAELYGLESEISYEFKVTAFSSGTPYYRENTFSTRGRGAEITISVPGQSGGGMFGGGGTQIMTKETYGTDEVYTVGGIKQAGTVGVTHTYGVAILNNLNVDTKGVKGNTVTLADVIADGEIVKPGDVTREWTNLTQFGISQTKWGQIDVRVIAGTPDEGGKVEVILNYDDNVDQNVVDTIYLPATPLPNGYILPRVNGGRDVVWSCEEQGVLSDDGYKLISGPAPKTVTLTATSGTGTKDFNLTIAPIGSVGSLSDDKKSATASIDNPTNETKTYKFIIVAYEESTGKLAKVAVKDVEVPAGTIVEATVEFPDTPGRYPWMPGTPYDLTGKTVKAFIWDAEGLPDINALS